MEASVMKVKVHCCRSCQRKAKKILEQAPGVQAVRMDKSEGLLTVTGDVEPLLLIETVEEEVRKRVELWSFRRYPARSNTEEGRGNAGATKGNTEAGSGGDGAPKEANLRGARDGKKAACRRRADRERAGHADPASAGLRWPGPAGHHPVAGPCQHHGDPVRPLFWGPHGPPPPACYGPPLFPPPYPWYYPMPPPPMQPPPPYCYHHESRRPKQ
ncbi:heavy metal-associated isoprenylated plant protein 36-like isoform X2 [Rhodamnia argentea]|uniref:Heavy metal-associated isoprenylated plant protein 36-like isoform X2 n=1 Tax=Rhodamnia argentea TaxID=178133 RepID=A0ABM3HTZ4_9MYRT|nr:heavy metal-associated isoprenylated plant protein 36-like isoform X2 [Rhodamnia argentea]